MTDATRHGISSLVQAARAGWHTLPQTLLDDFTTLETLATQYENDPQPGTATQAAELTAQMRTATRGGNADQLITQHIQPALTQFLTDFQSDATAAGQYAAAPKPTLAMLEEPDSIQQAYTRLAESTLRWTSIRTSWRILRGLSLAPIQDPAGLDSIHAEIGNTLTLRPIWDPHSPYSRLASPWGEGVFHLRLKWLLDHDAQVWAPTATEQTTSWIENNPELVIR
ncbi:hypothetical protein HLK59_38030 [Streptomyces sp. S3(2020)]|uniref:hypothetical protein n=1 Tax=Streptomyces sp. S3(2020) TaxID=2732044 RepID=UPI0014876875|nr:hypothetical protein [Streptomyces sp. S3(2020)]NNN36064.1 hypothetical protein [Streptomyces sp. S3(2020)]